MVIEEQEVGEARPAISPGQSEGRAPAQQAQRRQSPGCSRQEDLSLSRPTTTTATDTYPQTDQNSQTLD